MNKPQFRTFLSALDSLCGSTAVTIATPWGTAVLDGRCSPYLSHQSVAYVERATPCVVISNNRHAIAIPCCYGTVDKASLPVPLEATCDLEWVELQVPKTHLESLLSLVAKLFGHQAKVVAEGSLLATIWLALPILEGYEPDKEHPGRMRPVFKLRRMPEPDEAEVETEEVSYTAKFGGPEDVS